MSDLLISAGMTSREYVTALPLDPGSPVPVEAPAAAPAEAPDVWDRAASLLDLVPGWVWAGALGALFLAAVATFPLMRRQAHKAGVRSAGQSGDSDGQDRGLFAIALTVAGLFWLAVLYGSASGLMAFGRDTLHWPDGRALLVPFTLDGVAVAFGLLSFLAVRGNRSPDRSMLIAWCAMAASAGINFYHEARSPVGSTVGGAYLGLLSLLGMLIFHEFLAQFESGAGEIDRKRPKFGLRWITYTPNTLCAALAWINHPPDDGTRATVIEAVANLERVRAQKRARRLAAADAGRPGTGTSALSVGDAPDGTPAVPRPVAPNVPGTDRGTGTPKSGGTGRRPVPGTGTATPRTDSELLRVLRNPNRVPRESDGSVPVKRAAKVLGTGPDRARRLLAEAGLLSASSASPAPAASPALPLADPPVLAHANGSTPTALAPPSTPPKETPS